MAGRPLLRQSHFCETVSLFCDSVDRALAVLVETALHLLTDKLNSLVSSELLSKPVA